MNKALIVSACALLCMLGAGLGCAPAEEDGDDGGGSSGAGGATVPPAGGAGAGGAPGAAAGAGGSVAGGAGGRSGAGGAAAGSGGAGGMVAGGSGGAGGAGGMGGAGGAAGMAGMMAGAGGAGGGAFELSSTAVENDAMLPEMYRCVALGGDPGPSPPLTWTAGPTGTMSYTIVFKDTSPAGTTGAGTFHWVIKNIPMGTMMLPMEVAIGAMPGNVSGATQVANNVFLSNDIGYRGPCGGMNDYTFTLYAVNKASIAAGDAAGVETEAKANNVGTSALVIHSAPP